MTATQRLVVTGADGQLGWELVRALQPIGEVIPLTRRELDLADLSLIDPVLSGHRPTVICNAAAYTAVDRAESDEAVAMLVNGEAPGVIGEVARRLGAAVVHVSTDYVFDGRAEQPYREDDATNPLNVYGRTKLAGERALAQSGAASLTARTSWLYAMRGHNFVRTMLRLAEERDTLRVVSDQHGTPTWARWLAQALSQIVAQLTRHADGTEASFRRLGGVVHVTGEGSTTWHDFAQAILAHDPRVDHRATRVDAIASEEYPTPALRPLRAVLDSRQAEERFGVRRTPWLDQLRLALSERVTS